MLDTNYSRLQLGQRSPRSYAESAHSNHGRILEVALHPEDGTLPPEQQEAALVALSTMIRDTGTMRGRPWTAITVAHHTASRARPELSRAIFGGI
jgi:hypothetical protein